MDRSEYVSCLQGDAEALLTAASGQLDTPVPTCPGWSVERLVGHMGRVYRWTAGWVALGERTTVEPAPSGDAVLPWTREGLDALVVALGAADMDATVATWVGEQPAIFWPRRMAVETALHRWDAQNAVANPAGVDTQLAIDGIDETLVILLPGRRREGLEALDAAGTSLHVHATDAPGEWQVSFVEPPEYLRVERTHGKGDVAVRGAASDLLLLLWNRVGLDALEVFGDADLLRRWPEAIKMT